MTRTAGAISLAALAATSLACGGVLDTLAPTTPWDGEQDVRLTLACESDCAGGTAVLVGRLESLGVDYRVHEVSADSLELTLEGVGDLSLLKEGWLSHGVLGFHRVVPAGTPGAASICDTREDPCQPLSYDPVPALDHSHLSGASLDVDDLGLPVLMVHWTEPGRAAFHELSKGLVDRKLLMLLDDEVLMAPIVKEPIDQPSAQISLGHSSDEAEVDLILAAVANPPLQGDWLITTEGQP